MTEKIGKYPRDQLFHAIFRKNDPTTIFFVYFPHHKVEANQALRGLTCIISEELLFNAKDVITRSWIK